MHLCNPRHWRSYCSSPSHYTCNIAQCTCCPTSTASAKVERWKYTNGCSCQNIRRLDVFPHLLGEIKSEVNSWKCTGKTKTTVLALIKLLCTSFSRRKCYGCPSDTEQHVSRSGQINSCLWHPSPRTSRCLQIQYQMPWLWYYSRLYRTDPPCCLMSWNRRPRQLELQSHQSGHDIGGSISLRQKTWKTFCYSLAGQPSCCYQRHLLKTQEGH